MSPICVRKYLNIYRSLIQPPHLLSFYFSKLHFNLNVDTIYSFFYIDTFKNINNVQFSSHCMFTPLLLTRSNRACLEGFFDNFDGEVVLKK